MREHVKRAHPSLPGKASAKPTAQPTLPRHDIAKPVSKLYSAASSNEVTNFITDWLTGDSRPLSVVNNVGFRSVIDHLASGYVLPSRTNVNPHQEAYRRETRRWLEKLKTKLSTVD